MKLNEIEKFGFTTVLVNIIITLFMLTSKDINYSYYIVTIISNVIAIIFSIYLIRHAKKKILNIISLGFNIIIFILVLIYTIIKYNFI